MTTSNISYKEANSTYLGLKIQWNSELRHIPDAYPGYAIQQLRRDNKEKIKPLHRPDSGKIPREQGQVFKGQGAGEKAGCSKGERIRLVQLVVK